MSDSKFQTFQNQWLTDRNLYPVLGDILLGWDDRIERGRHQGLVSFPKSIPFVAESCCAFDFEKKIIQKHFISLQFSSSWWAWPSKQLAQKPDYFLARILMEMHWEQRLLAFR